MSKKDELPEGLTRTLEVEELGAVGIAPKYDIGDSVVYFDYQARTQIGEVFRIEANWWKAGEPPWLTYTIRHPTYRNKRAHVSPENIVQKEIK